MSIKAGEYRTYDNPSPETMIKQLFEAQIKHLRVQPGALRIQLIPNVHVMEFNHITARAMANKLNELADELEAKIESWNELS